MTRDEAAAYLDQWRLEQAEHIYTENELDAAVWFATCAHTDLVRETSTGTIAGLTANDYEALAWQARHRAHTNALTARGRAA